MRIGLLAAVGLLGLVPPVSAQDPTRSVVTRAEIDAAGWINIGEILQGAAGWHRSTLDAVWYLASPDRLPPGAVAPTGAAWVVVIDGQRLYADVLGARLLELLPVSPAQIESVTVSRVPRLVAGAFATNGVIEIHTARVRRGPAAIGGWQSGNVIGDPGPYGFTPLGGENVDRLGPYDHALVSYGATGWDAAIGAREGSSHITHREIRRRFEQTQYDALGERKWAPYDAVNARLTAILLARRHDVIAGRGWVHGPLFLPSIGGEQWAVGRLDHLGAGGAVPVGGGTARYQLMHSVLTLEELPTPFPFIAGHERGRTAAAIDLSTVDSHGAAETAGATRSARLGLGVARSELKRDGSGASRTDATLFAQLAASARPFANELSLALSRSTGGPVVGKGVVTTRLQADSHTTVAVALSLAQHAIGDDGAWIDRALLGLDTLQRDRLTSVAADAGIIRRLAGAWIADVGARFAWANGIELLPVSGQGIGEPMSLGTAELRAGIRRSMTPRIPVARAGYRYARSVSGNEVLRQAARATAAHTLDGQVIVAVAGDFRVGAAIFLASGTSWESLRGAAAVPTELAAITRVDVSLEKWFWRRHLRTQLLVRNALNRPERSHPLGADLPLRVHLGIGLDLP